MPFYRRLLLGRGAPHAIWKQNMTQPRFDVPTLPYGKDALETFPKSINDETFHWTAGTLSDLERFLEKHQTIGEPGSNYVVSSLDLA